MFDGMRYDIHTRKKQLTIQKFRWPSQRAPAPLSPQKSLGGSAPIWPFLQLTLGRNEGTNMRLVQTSSPVMRWSSGFLKHTITLLLNPSLGAGQYLSFREPNLLAFFGISWFRGLQGVTRTLFTEKTLSISCLMRSGHGFGVISKGLLLGAGIFASSYPKNDTVCPPKLQDCSCSPSSFDLP